MNICIFGAGGRTGLKAVCYAHEKGYDVTAFVYNESSKKFFPRGVKTIQGNILNYDSVCKAIEGTDAVISVVGHIKGSDPLMQTRGMQNIVRAMELFGVTRVLSLTGTGVRIAGDSPSILDRILNVIIGIVDPERVKDGIEHVKVLQGSKSNWTVVRVLKLSRSNRLFENYELTEGGPAELFTSRKKVAHVLVDLIEDKKYIGKMPVISG